MFYPFPRAKSARVYRFLILLARGFQFFCPKGAAKSVFEHFEIQPERNYFTVYAKNVSEASIEEKLAYARKDQILGLTLYPSINKKLILVLYLKILIFLI